MSSTRSRSGGRKISKRVDAVHQVFAEVAGRDHFGQVAVRGADDAHVDGERFVFADAADFAAFQHAQQLGLHRLGQLADFVEKDRAAVGDFEQADAMLVGPGERAFAMAEQLAFDQRFGQRAAVDRHERHRRPAGFDRARSRATSSLPVPVSPKMSTVDCVGATLAISVRTRSMPAEVPTSRGVPSMRSSRRLSARYCCVSLRLILHAAHQRFDFDQLAGLGEIIERAVAQGGDGRFERRLAGEHDRVGVGATAPLRLGDHLDAVEARHVEVDQQAVERVLLERGGRRDAVWANGHAVAHPRNLELHQLLQRALVVGKEDGSPLDSFERRGLLCDVRFVVCHERLNQLKMMRCNLILRCRQ